MLTVMYDIAQIMSFFIFFDDKTKENHGYLTIVLAFLLIIRTLGFFYGLLLANAVSLVLI